LKESTVNDNTTLQLREIAQKRVELQSLPSTYNIELTGRCNYNPPCVYCVGKNRPNYNPPGNLDISMIDKSWASLRQAERINDCSYGEPLLYPGFESLVERFASAGIKFGFSTNGLLLTEKKADFLVKHAGTIEFVVSLSAATPETYYRLHGQDFNAVIGNVKRYIELYEAEHGSAEPPLILSYIAMRSNADEVMDFLSLTRSLGVNNVMFRPLLDFVAGSHYVCDSFGHEFDYENEKLGLDYYTELENHIREQSEFSSMKLSYQWSSQESFVAEMLDGESEIPCLFPWKFMNIRNLHDMYLPCMFLQESIGSPSEASVEDIWNSKTLVEMRESLVSGDIPQFCSNHSISCPLVLEKDPQATRPPMISVKPPALSATFVKRIRDAIQGFTIWNRGGGVLSYSITTDADWLYCEPTSGVSSGQPQSIEVHTRPSALGPGKFGGTITVSAPGALNNPQTIEVTLTVTEVPNRMRRNIKRLFRIKRHR
jgi:MoaA/NifB/PqqE/SkfB family radical SAM enzyme